MKIFKSLWIIVFIKLIPTVTNAGYILKNDCVEIKSNGTLKPLDSNSSGCGLKIHASKFFSDSKAEGYLGNSPYAITISKKNNSEYHVYEISPDPTNWDFQASINATSTHVKDESVTDQTTCSRHIRSSNPIVTSDSLTCITVNKSFCSNFYEASKLKTSMGKNLDLAEVQKCQSFIEYQISTMQTAVNKSFQNADYKKLTQTRYDEMKINTSPYVNSSLMGKTKWTLNDSSQNYESGGLSFRDLQSGYAWMQNMLNVCLKYFPPEERKIQKNTEDKISIK